MGDGDKCSKLVRTGNHFFDSMQFSKCYSEGSESETAASVEGTAEHMKVLFEKWNQLIQGGGDKAFVKGESKAVEEKTYEPSFFVYPKLDKE